MIDIEEAPGYAYEDGAVYNKKTGKRLKPALSGSGYPVVRPYSNGAYVNLSMHRLVAKYDLGVTGQVIEHKNDNKLDFSKENLFASTQRANITKALGKAVIGTHVLTGETKVFVSAAEAARFVKCEPSRITAICKKRRGYKTAGGYTFTYRDE